MDKKIEKLKKDFPELKVERKEYHFTFSDAEEESGVYYLISGLEGNSNLQIYIEKDEELKNLISILKKKIFVFNDFLAIKHENTIEVLLTPLSYRTSYRHIDRDDEENFKLIEIGLNYHRNELNISVEIGETNKILPQFANLVRGAKRYSRKPIILKIENYQKQSLDGIVNDTRNIINSVLFDIEYNYDVALETVNIEGLLRRIKRRKKRTSELPKEKINLVFKKYIPELIQYFHIAEKVDFLPFKFICYYHIIEYFSDKSAYHIVSGEVKKLLLKPDFHLKTDTYVNQAINLFKRENDKHTNDKVKIERVLKQYIDREALKEAMTELELVTHFSAEETLDCSKPLKLPAINFDQDGNFYSELTKRIYSIRCSIVHSNPDFDETKAVPFVPSPANIEKLRTEMEIVIEIARMIIVESKGE